MFLWKPNTCLKGTVAQDFLPPTPDLRFNGQKYAERCGSEALKLRTVEKKCDCGIAQLQLRSNISLKSCGIAIAEVLPSNCRIAIADSKKVACAHLCPLALLFKYLGMVIRNTCSNIVG
jgi:hypothetical protein